MAQELLDLEPDEKALLRLRRTKLGLIPIIASGGVVIIGLLIATFFIARYQTTIAKTIPVSTALLISIGVAVLVGLILTVSIIVYLGNELLLTNERIVSFVQNSLFSRETAQLELEHVEDVTVKQANIFESLFNYGTVIIQTAGEMDNFIFKLAKSPSEAAKTIRDAVEQYGLLSVTHRPDVPVQPAASPLAQPQTFVAPIPPSAINPDIPLTTVPPTTTSAEQAQQPNSSDQTFPPVT